MREPDVNKKQLGVLIPLDLYAKVRKEAERMGISVSELVTIALQREFSRVELTENDILWIADQVRNNNNKRERNRKR